MVTETFFSAFGTECGCLLIPVKGLIHLSATVLDYAKFLWCLLDEHQLLQTFFSLKIVNTFLSIQIENQKITRHS